MKKAWTVSLIFIIIILNVGCTEQKKPEETKNPELLDDIALTLQDLNGSYEQLDESYVTEPYLSDDSKLFSGWNVNQKYSVIFYHNETDFIQHEIVELQSAEKTEEFQMKLSTDIDNLGYNFTTIEVDPIGNITLLFEAEAIINNSAATIFLLTYSYEDIVVIIQTSNSKQELIIEYGNIIQSKIEKIIENGQ